MWTNIALTIVFALLVINVIDSAYNHTKSRHGAAPIICVAAAIASIAFVGWIYVLIEKAFSI
jgi:hypothetical protein